MPDCGWEKEGETFRHTTTLFTLGYHRYVLIAIEN
jgi:hypothetical protein